MNFEKLLPYNSKRREFAKKVARKLNITTAPHTESDYEKWIQKNEPTQKELEQQKQVKFEITPKISILVPLFRTPEKFFKDLVNSLKNQTYANWELCLADGTPEGSIAYIKKYLSDQRIRYKYIGENKGISGNTNEALTLATGEYIGLLDHDDFLPVFSLYEIVKVINQNKEVEFIYTDEDKMEGVNKPRYGVFFKPDPSPYTLNSANYICHFSIFKKELMDKLQGFRSEYDGSQDFDIVARAFENTDKIVHIPKVLYHWRVHQNSTAGNSGSKPYAFEVGKKVIQDHVKRYCQTEVEVTDGLTPGSYELIYIPNNTPKVSILFDARTALEEDKRRIVDEVYKSDYKNYELIIIDDKKATIEEAIQKTDAEYFIIVDKDLLEIPRKSYIQELLGIAQDNRVGIVGTKLYNTENLVEHNGIIIGMNGIGDFLYKGAPKDIGTYMQRLTIIHNVSCVLTKYAMIRKQDYLTVNGFEEKYKGITKDIDFCLKILKHKKQVVLNPIISFKIRNLYIPKDNENIEKEFLEKWKKEYEKGDIYYSPNLSNTNNGLSIKID